MKVFQQNRVLAILIIIWYIVGILGFLIPGLKPWFQQLTPVGIVLAAFLLLFYHEPKDLKSAVAFSGIVIATFTAEMIGVNTRRLFGHYMYGPALGFQQWNTPVVIGLNWLVLVYGLSVLLKRFSQYWYYPLLGAAVMTAFDFIMEPVANATGMWTWDKGVIPLKNYADWFLLSALLFLFLQLFKIEFNNRLAPLIFLMQAVF
ncbi:MAG: carotenoid biosynthesis protein, partial [Methylococcaceae bacterium]